MSVIYIFFALLAVLLLVDFKKGVLLYAPMKLFFNINVRLGSVTFDLAISTIIILLFLFKRKSLQTERFPLTWSFILYGLGYAITCLYPDYVPNFIPRIIVVVLGFSFVYFYCIQNIKDVRFALVAYAIFAVIMCGNGLLQPLMHINPLDDFSQSLSDVDNSLFLDNDWVRNGQVRYRSFIPHAISYGVSCCVIFYAIVWQYLVVKENAKGKMLMLTALLLLLSGMIICGSRTPILGLLPLSYIFFNKKYVSTKIRWRLIVLVLIFLLLQGDYILYSIESIINPKIAAEAGGSSTEMRLSQYSIAFGWMMENPFLGKGMNFDAYLANSQILGGESVWLPLMMNNGFVGVISYVILCIGTYKVFSKSPGKLFLLLFSLGWLIMRTATSLIGVTDAQFFTCMFIIYRYYQINTLKYGTINNHTNIQC